MDTPDEDESKYSKDSNYPYFKRDFKANLDSFVKARDWPDLIKCLSGLKSVFGKYPQFQVVPYKLSFCKVLAQCLNPSLPPGVQTKALETCELAFTRIGPKGIASDVALYSWGIFPLFQYASQGVKALVYSFIKTHFVPLGPALIPCLPGLILAIIPGLEDENGDFFHQCLELLRVVVEKTDKGIVWASCWKFLLLNSSLRKAILNFLLSELPKPDTLEFNIDIHLPDLNNLVLSAIIAAIQDSDTLVQRAALECVLIYFPLDKMPLGQKQVPLLVSAMLGSLLKREVSLSRRVIGHLLVSHREVKDDHLGDSATAKKSLFLKYAKDHTVLALKHWFSKSEKGKSALIPFHIISLLFEQPQIGEAIISDVVKFVLHSLQKNKDIPELVTAANELLEEIKPEIIWSILYQYVETSVINIPSGQPLTPLIELDALLDTLSNLGSQPSQSTFLPRLIITLINSLSQVLESRSLHEILVILQLMFKTLGKIHEFPDVLSDDARLSVSGYKKFYSQLVETILLPAWRTSDSSPASSTNSFEMLGVYDLASQLLVTLHLHFKIPAPSDEQPSPPPPWFLLTVKVAEAVSNPMVQSLAIRTFNTLVTSPPNGDMINTSLGEDLLPKIAEKLWGLFNPAFSSVHYAAATIFLNSKQLLGNTIENMITEGLASKDNDTRISALFRFALLWRLTGELRASEYQPSTTNLFHALDCLEDEQAAIRMAARTWIVDSMPKIERVLDPLILFFINATGSKDGFQYSSGFDYQTTVYVIKKFRSLVDSHFQSFLQNLEGFSITRSLQERYLEWSGKSEEEDKVVSGNQAIENTTQANKPDFSSLDVHENIFSNLSDIAEGQDVQPKESDQAQVQDPNTQVTDKTKVRCSYLEVLVSVLCGFLESRPSTTTPSINLIRNKTTEFLQHIFSKTSNPNSLEFANIMQERVITILSSLMKSEPHNFILQTQILSFLKTLAVLAYHNKIRPSIFPSLSSMLQQTIVAGLLTQNSEFNVRYFWLEFITDCLPFLHESIDQVVSPVVHTICDIISAQQNIYDSIGSKDLLMMLGTLKTIFGFMLLDRAPSEGIPRGEEPHTEQPTDVGKLMRNAFIHPFQFLAGVAKEPKPQSTLSHSMSRQREELLKKIPNVLVHLWGSPKAVSPYSQISEFTTDATHNRFSVQDFVIPFLGPYIRDFPAIIIEGILERWFFDPSSTDGALLGPATRLKKREKNRKFLVTPPTPMDRHLSPAEYKVAAIELLITLAELNVQSVIESAIKIIKQNDSIVTCVNVFEFVLLFLTSCPPAAKSFKDVWPALLDLISDSLESHSPYTYFLMAHIIAVYSKKIGSIKQGDRKRLQTITTTLIDSLCVIASPNFREDARFKPDEKEEEETRGYAGPRRSQDHSDDESQTPRLRREESLRAPPRGSADLSPVKARRNPDAPLLPVRKNVRMIVPTIPHETDLEITDRALTILSCGLSALLFIVWGRDKLIPIVTHATWKILPVLKDRTLKNFDLSAGAAKIIQDLCRMEEILVGANAGWQKEMMAIFYAQDFFQMDVKQLKAWSSILNTFIKHDNTIFPEFMKTLSYSLITAPGPFLTTTARQQYNINRALNVKRLAFMIFSGEYGQYEQHVPLIQEKLCEALKANAEPDTLTSIKEYIFLCLRVLLVRCDIFRQKKVESFWPVILTEMVSMFSAVQFREKLVLSVTKFLDLMLVLPIEQFNIWRWIFLKEQTNSSENDPPQDQPEGSFVPYIEKIAPTISGNSMPFNPVKQRPLILFNTLNEQSYKGFLSFLSQFSNLSYGNCVSGTSPDMPFIHKLLQKDFLDVPEETTSSSTGWIFLGLDGSS